MFYKVLHEMVKKCPRLCYEVSGFFRDLMLLEVSEANGIVWFIVGSVCEQF